MGEVNVTTDAAVFRLEGVTKRYGDLVALDNVTLEASENEYISFLGPSASGKTTLLRVMAGFEAPQAGRVVFNGRDITNVPAHERGIGFVFQNFALFPHLPVIKNVGFGLTYGKSKLDAAEVARRSQEMIDLVGLAGLEDRGINQLSGGQLQRVALARTLTMQPKLVLLDEPLGALDANLRGRMRNELRAIRKRLGVTFVHVTGSETEAFAMGDRVVVLGSGRIVQSGRPGEIYDQPASPDVAHFLNRFNFFDGKLVGEVFVSAFGNWPALAPVASDRSAYVVRYDRMRAVGTDEPVKGPHMRARFIASEYLGSSYMYFFEAEGGQVVEMEHHLSLGAPPDLKPRQTYQLTWDSDQAIVFGREAH